MPLLTSVILLLSCSASSPPKSGSEYHKTSSLCAGSNKCTISTTFPHPKQLRQIQPRARQKCLNYHLITLPSLQKKKSPTSQVHIRPSVCNHPGSIDRCRSQPRIHGAVTAKCRGTQRRHSAALAPIRHLPRSHIPATHLTPTILHLPAGKGESWTSNMHPSTLPIEGAPPSQCTTRIRFDALTEQERHAPTQPSLRPSTLSASIHVSAFAAQA